MKLSELNGLSGALTTSTDLVLLTDVSAEANVYQTIAQHKVALGISVADSPTFVSVKATADTGGIGYATGAGETATQATSKSTTVTNTASAASLCGAITMHNANLAAATIVSFTFTNSAIAATDVLVLNHISGGTVGSYTLNAQAGAGSATINVRNNTGGGLAEAIVIQYAVIKAVNA